MAQAKSKAAQSGGTPYRVLIGFDYTSPVDGEPHRAEPGDVVTDVPEGDVAWLEGLAAITSQIELPAEEEPEPEVIESVFFDAPIQLVADEPVDAQDEDQIVTNEGEV